MKVLKDITDSEAKLFGSNALFYNNDYISNISGDLINGYKILNTTKINETDINFDRSTRLYFMYSDMNDKYIVYAGETSYGGSGFICLFDLHTKNPLWVLHLDNCNNFNSVKFKSNKIIAFTDEPFPNGSRFIIPILNPDKFIVENV